MNTDRKTDLVTWVNDCLKRKVIFTALPVEASTRKFFRVSDHQSTWIAIDSPTNTENNGQFVFLSQLMRRHGIPVPEVFHHNQQRGFLLVQDFGDNLFEGEYHHGGIDTCMKLAIENLVKVQSLWIPQMALYTEDRFRMELGIFKEWICGKLLGVPYDPLDDVENVLIGPLPRHTQVVVHRDYHCRNLLLRKNGGLGIVDFQDALIGPITYDLASLLYDCYFEFPENVITNYVRLYFEQIQTQHLSVGEDGDTFKLEVQRTAIQRQIKAVGIFVRLWMQHHRASHLVHVVPLLHRITRLAGRYHELESLSNWLRDDITPQVKQALREWEENEGNDPRGRTRNTFKTANRENTEANDSNRQ